MTDRDPIAAYRASSLETAPPVKIVRLLYQSAIVHLERAMRTDPSTESEVFNESLSKADSIVSELRFALDHGVDQELCTQLESLYLFCEDEIGKSFGGRDASNLPAVINILRTLLAAWEEVEVQVEQAA